ncbi:MaoC family dehydratase N-terminal domain-containing protein [Streptomyces sp. NRRL F-5053]|uniref:MaoC family dehydratase N-terminal domain-containing protein n=1 Tax=Streptomyces sp. NRRL F-5053 TaxID=1463854 RepID=UPI0004C51CBD|nr:MaoC family dehydratase N-terminal domain-containing protein [Streptomyces sp. NRRL F-5053]
MAIDQSFVGRTYPPSRPYEVGREKIREFAQAIGDTNPACTDVEAAAALGHPDVVAPPTFVFALSFEEASRVVQDPQLGLDYSRVVHRDQKFSYTRPVRAGDVLSVTSTIESVKSLAGNEMVAVRGEVEDGTGKHVVTVHTTLVARALEEE